MSKKSFSRRIVYPNTYLEVPYAEIGAITRNIDSKTPREKTRYRIDVRSYRRAQDPKTPINPSFRSEFKPQRPINVACVARGTSTSDYGIFGAGGMLGFTENRKIRYSYYENETFETGETKNRGFFFFFFRARKSSARANAQRAV